MPKSYQQISQANTRHTSLIGLLGLVVLACGEGQEMVYGQESGAVHGQVSQGLDLSATPTAEERAAMRRSTEEAFEIDIALTAEALGRPVEVVREAAYFQEDFGEKTEKLVQQHSNQVAAIWLDLDAIEGHVVFVGEKPAIADELEQDPRIKTRSGANLSMTEQHARVKVFAETLKALGYDRFGVYYEQQSQRIKIEHEADMEAEDIQEIRDQVSRVLSERSMPRAEYVPEFDLIQQPEVGIALQSVMGGTSMRDGGVLECTSAFTVKTFAGVKGVLTARHCSGLDSILSGTVYTSNYQSAMPSYMDGDVEWHTTFGNEIGSFFARANEIRDLETTRHTGGQVGSNVCVFGRASNNRECGHTVTGIGQCYTATNLPGNPLICSLAATSHAGTAIVGGDSGGNWSWGTRGFGVLSGFRNDRLAAYYTPIDEAVFDTPGVYQLLHHGLP